MKERGKKKKARIFSPCTSPLNFPLTFKRCLLGWLQASCGQMPTSLLTNCSGRIPRENSGPSLKLLHPVLPKQGSASQGHAESWKFSLLKDTQAALSKRGEWEKCIFQHQKPLLPSKREAGDSQTLPCSAADRQRGDASSMDRAPEWPFLDPRPIRRRICFQQWPRAMGRV